MKIQSLVPLVPLLGMISASSGDGTISASLPAATISVRIGDSTVVLRRLMADSATGGFYAEAASPDGRYLVGADRGARGLAIKDVRTGVVRPIPTKAGFPTEWVEASIFSPDGKSVAFTWGENRQKYLLSTIGIDGSRERTLFTPNDVLEYVTPEDWSADGRELLAYVYARDKTTQIAFLSTTDGAIRVLKSIDWRSSRGVRLSPDGRAIAFDLQLEKDAGGRDLFILEADGSRETRITSDRQPKTLLGWSTDGLALFYVTDSGSGTTLWRVPVNAQRQPGKPETVRADLFGVQPVRLQGSTLYYFVSSIRQAILTGQFDFETGRSVASLAPAAEGDVDSYGPALWSGNGRQLAFIRRTPSSGISQVTLALRHSASGDERRIPLELQRAQLVRWESGDRGITIRGWRRGQEAEFLLTLATGELTRTGDAPGNPPRFPSPDGKVEYYIKRGVLPNVAAVVARNLATGSEQELYRVSQPNGPSLSPDGRRFAFRSPDSTGAQVLTILSTQVDSPPIVVSGLPRKLRNETWTWTPDSRYAVRAFITDEGHELWSVSATTGEARRLLLSKRLLLYPHVGPDGRIVLGSNLGDNRLELWVMEHLRSSSTPRSATR